MKQKGFSLIEIEIAIAVLLICSIAFSFLYITGFQSSKKARAVTYATFLAQEKMEEISSQRFIINPIKEKDNFPEPFSSYHFSSTIEDHQGFPFLKRIEVIVEGPENTRVCLISLRAFK